MIFQVQYKEGITTNQITSMIVPTMKQIIKIYDEFGALMPTWDFYYSYEKGDKRTEEKEMFFTKDGHRDDKTNIIEFGSPALYKYYDIEGATKTASVISTLLIPSAGSNVHLGRILYSGKRGSRPVVLRYGECYPQPCQPGACFRTEQR